MWKNTAASPVPVDIQRLDARAFVVYRFGVYILDLLSKQLGSERVNLLIASALPPSDYARNAYKQSIFFDMSSSTLFIRQERLQSIGEFVLVAIHAMAHIAAKNMVDDSDHGFQKEFHRALRACCEEMFFLRAQFKGTQQPPQALKEAIDKTDAVDDKSDAVDSYLQSRVNTASARDLEAIQVRIASYTEQIVGDNIRSEIENIEVAPGNTQGTRDRVKALSAELTQLRAKSAKSAQKPTGAVQSTLMQSQIDILKKREVEAASQLSSSTQFYSSLSEQVKSSREVISKLQEGSQAYENARSSIQGLEATLIEAMSQRQQAESELAAVSMRLAALQKSQADKKVPANAV